MLEDLKEGAGKIMAPEFQGIRAWLNTKPLTMAGLRGKVVLVDFWTYTCVNCLRTLPHVKKWHEKYAKKGLVIVGVHTPEFGFEKDVANVEKAMKQAGIGYPVAVDSDMGTWNAYANRYWPAKYLIDKDGYIVYIHFGEGGYEQTEKAIQAQLHVRAKAEAAKAPRYIFDQSPETYAGVSKSYGLGSGMACDSGGCDVYIDSGKHERNTIYPNGRWVQENDFLELKKEPGQLSYMFNAREVNMVMEPVGAPVNADVLIDGKKIASIRIDGPRMYNVFRDKKGNYGERELEVVFHGFVRVYAYTFG
jgi:thiol-disulfide isomerase/thioredoxin